MEQIIGDKFYDLKRSKLVCKQKDQFAIYKDPFSGFFRVPLFVDCFQSLTEDEAREILGRKDSDAYREYFGDPESDETPETPPDDEWSIPQGEQDCEHCDRPLPAPAEFLHPFTCSCGALYSYLNPSEDWVLENKHPEEWYDPVKCPWLDSDEDETQRPRLRFPTYEEDVEVQDLSVEKLGIPQEYRVRGRVVSDRSTLRDIKEEDPKPYARVESRNTSFEGYLVIGAVTFEGKFDAYLELED